MALAVLFFISCEKEIVVELPEYKEKVCVDAKIEQGQYPTVFLTKNAAYFGSYDLNALLTYAITDALVIISDGTTTDTLTHLLYGFYTGTGLTGQVNRTYSLTIVAEGKTYTATTTILPPQPLDSLWFEVQGTMDSLGYIWAHFNEPAGIGNAYRWFAQRMNKDPGFIPPFGSAFDDKFIDGQTFDFGYTRGHAQNSSAEDDNNIEHGYFKSQDTVIIKFTTIDQASFDFWRTYETQAASEGNPFSSPGTIKSNILPKGEALGIFCGYGVWLDTLITQ